MSDLMDTIVVHGEDVAGENGDLAEGQRRFSTGAEAAAPDTGDTTMLTGGIDQSDLVINQPNDVKNTVGLAGTKTPCFSIHWLSISSDLERSRLGDWADRWFISNLGEASLAAGHWCDLGHGGRHYQEWFNGPFESRLMGRNYQAEDWSLVELPGEIMQLSTPDQLRTAIGDLEVQMSRRRCTRLDVCWDYTNISPAHCEDAYSSGKVEAASKRHTWYRSTSDTFYLGKNQGHGDWVLCVYDQRGYNRIEFRLYGPLADLAIDELCTNEQIDNWEKSMRSYLAQFVNINTKQWGRFMKCIVPKKFPERVHAKKNIDQLNSFISRQAPSIGYFVLAHNGWAALEQVVRREMKMRIDNRRLLEYGIDCNRDCIQELVLPHREGR